MTPEQITDLILDRFLSYPAGCANMWAEDTELDEAIRRSMGMGGFWTAERKLTAERCGCPATRGAALIGCAPQDVYTSIDPILRYALYEAEYSRNRKEIAVQFREDILKQVERLKEEVDFDYIFTPSA